MKIIKGNKLLYNFYDKNNYVVYIRSLKQALNHIKESTQSNQEAWLKPYMDMNSELRKQAKEELLTTDKRRNQLVLELNYHMKKWF